MHHLVVREGKHVVFGKRVMEGEKECCVMVLPKEGIGLYIAEGKRTELGWFKYVCGHGALNFIAGWAAIYFIASPILIIVFYFLKKNNINKAVTTLFGALITSVIMVALTVMIIYSGLYMMAEHPIISGLIILVGALVGLSSCYTVVQIVVVIEK